MPFFSVIIPVYNKEKWLRNCLQSVVSQTFRDIEIIVVNDGSTDKSMEIVENFCDSRIKIIDQVNHGVSVARNRGAVEAKGRFIAFLDADDFWSELYLNSVYDDVASNPNIKLWSCGYRFYKYDAEVEAKFSNISKGYKGFVSNYFSSSLSDPIITSSTVVIERSLFNQAGGFPAGQQLGEDLYFWFKCTRLTNLYFNDRELAYYRKEFENNTSSLLVCGKKLALLELCEEMFDYGDYSPVYYYLTYSRKNAFRLLKFGYVRTSLSVINRSAHYAIRCKKLGVFPIVFSTYFKFISVFFAYAIIKKYEHRQT